MDQTALETAQKVTQRAKVLFEQDENVSRKTLEAAQSDERADEIRLRTAERSLTLAWGGAIAGLSGAERRDWVDKIAAHRVALLRVELPMGETMTGAPESIQVFAAGRGRAIPPRLFRLRRRQTRRPWGRGSYCGWTKRTQPWRRRRR